MSSSEESAAPVKNQFFTGTGPAITLWVLVVLALGYGVVKTVETALTLFTG